MTDKPESVGREVLYEVVDGHIGLVRLNRPDKRNAVNGDLAAALDWIVKATEADPEIRVVILGSTSDGAFCAGADLSEISKGRGHMLSTNDGGFGGLARANREKPWIAAVAAPALAGGCDGETGGPCPVDHLADQRRLVAGETVEIGWHVEDCRALDAA